MLESSRNLGIFYRIALPELVFMSLYATIIVHTTRGTINNFFSYFCCGGASILLGRQPVCYCAYRLVLATARSFYLTASHQKIPVVVQLVCQYLLTVQHIF